MGFSRVHLEGRVPQQFGCHSTCIRQGHQLVIIAVNNQHRHLLRQRQKSLGGQTFERWVDLGNHFAEREPSKSSHSLAVSSEKNFFSVSICAVTLVFDREGYSPSFFAEMKTKRIAILSYHKFPGEPWPQSNGAKRSRP